MSTRCIVIAGSFSGLTTEFGLANGFRGLGWSVHQVDCTEFSGGYSGRYARVLRRLRLPLTIRRYNEAIIEMVRIVAPPFFLTVKGGYISRKTLSVIRDLGIVTINYYPDTHFDHPGVREADFVLYDHFITTKSFQVGYLRDRLGAERVDFLHHGYVSGFHVPPPAKAPQADSPDILYIGSHSLEKERWLRAVKVRFPCADFRIYGSRWDTVRDPELFGATITGVPLHGRDYAQAICSAKVNLAIHMGSLGAHGWADLVSTRTFEIPACRGFMLHVDNEEVRRLFNPGTEIDVFSNEKELCDKIGFYLGQDQIRDEMAKKAYGRAVPAYGYDARARAIADRIKPETL
jgi:spore maturation protein CgeB